MSTETKTMSVLALVPGRAASEVELAPGSTVADLARALSIDATLPARDALGNVLDPSTVIGPETEAVSFVFKIAGA